MVFIAVVELVTQIKRNTGKKPKHSKSVIATEDPAIKIESNFFWAVVRIIWVVI